MFSTSKVVCNVYLRKIFVLYILHIAIELLNRLIHTHTNIMCIGIKECTVKTFFFFIHEIRVNIKCKYNHLYVEYFIKRKYAVIYS